MMSWFSKWNKIIRYTKFQYKTYFVFLLFTTLVWLALQFSENYSKEVLFEIEYITGEQQKVITTESDDRIRMILEGNGFNLLGIIWLNRKIKLDCRKAQMLSKDHGYYTGNRMLEYIKEGLMYKGEITHVLKDSIHVYFDSYYEKKVPLKINSKVTYAQGYRSVKGPIATHINEVTVLGPSSILDTLKSIPTQEWIVEDLDKSITNTLAFEYKFLEHKYLSLSDSKVDVELKVDKLTERVFNLPIKAINVPKNAKIQLFPKSVNVVFTVALKDYSKLSALDFSVVADLGKSDLSNSKLLLHLDQVPDNVYNTRLMKPEVEFILIQ